MILLKQNWSLLIQVYYTVKSDLDLTEETRYNSIKIFYVNC